MAVDAGTPIKWAHVPHRDRCFSKTAAAGGERAHDDHAIQKAWCSLSRTSTPPRLYRFNNLDPTDRHPVTIAGSAKRTTFNTARAGKSLPPSTFAEYRPTPGLPLFRHRARTISPDLYENSAKSGFCHPVKICPQPAYEKARHDAPDQSRLQQLLQQEEIHQTPPLQTRGSRHPRPSTTHPPLQAHKADFDRPSLSETAHLKFSRWKTPRAEQPPGVDTGQTSSVSGPCISGTPRTPRDTWSRPFLTCSRN